MKLPQHSQKYIAWHKSGDGVAYIVVGYCPDSLASFKVLGRELKKYFNVKEENITCSKISKSSSMYGFTIVLAAIKGPKRKIEGWSEREIDFNY